MPNQPGYVLPGHTFSVAGLDVHVTGYTDATLKLGVETGDEPLEDGTTATDHAAARAEEISLTAYVAGRRSKQRDDLNVTDAVDAIRRLHKQVEPFIVLAPWGRFEEMLLIGAETQSHGLGLRIVLQFRQIIRVGVQEGEITAGKASGPAAERTSEVKRGRIPLEGTVTVGEIEQVSP